MDMPTTCICLPHHGELSRGRGFHNFVKTDYPTLDELRARNSDIGPDLIVELSIGDPGSISVPDVFMIGSYFMVSDVAAGVLNADFEHTVSDAKIRTEVPVVAEKNYKRLIIDRNCEVIDMETSELSERQVLDITIRTPIKLILSAERGDFRGLVNDNRVPGLIFCDLDLAKRFNKAGLSGLQFFHPLTPPTRQKELCWISERGLEKNLPWDGVSQDLEHKLLIPFGSSHTLH